ncbi:hypothetical protein ABW21_db0208264 [Orbilia brochopaga]|nr:hypothetical protein ABW21_db0208264 [Drechslerella brochopaga]
MYSKVLIVGAGESGLCMGVQLKKRNLADFAIYERHSDIGGTWYANTYPGPELYAYFSKVCDDYNLRPHITFNTEVESATYDETRKLWSVRLRKMAVADWETTSHPWVKDLKYTGQVGDTWTHECKVLFTAVGLLIRPAEVKIDGLENFNGPVFHSALWDHKVDLEGKDVVLLGNGCTASQIVPAIEPQVRSLTQITRSPHWMLPRPKFPGTTSDNYQKYAPVVFRTVPGAQTLARYLTFGIMELSWLAFRNDDVGERQRKRQEQVSIAHVKKHAPEKYWDLLIPKFPIGFKRRIFDDLYVRSLNSQKITLTRDEVTKISGNTVSTASGATYPADVVVLATGFKTNDWIAPLDVVGRNGERLTEHWQKVGGPCAYNSAAVAGFPNFFMIVGPNSVTGHSSVILATENMVHYALTMAEPVLNGDADEIEVKPEAEAQYSRWMQDSLKKTVFNNDEFQSWYKRADGWNSSCYPRSQIHFQYRCYVPVHKDWILTKTAQGIWKSRIRKLLVLLFIFGVGALNMLLRRRGITFREAVQAAAMVVSTATESVRSLVGVKTD